MLTAGAPVQEMELGSHPALERFPENLASFSDLLGSALQGPRAPLPPSLREQSLEDAHSSSLDDNTALRRLLLKQMPASGVSTRSQKMRFSSPAALFPPARHPHGASML